MKISDALNGNERLGIETAPFIYHVENHPTYAAKVDSIFEYVEATSMEIHTSVTTVTETLVKPIQADDPARCSPATALYSHPSTEVSFALLRTSFHLRGLRTACVPAPC